MKTKKIKYFVEYRVPENPEWQFYFGTKDAKEAEEKCEQMRMTVTPAVEGRIRMKLTVTEIIGNWAKRGEIDENEMR